ncbi:MAG: 16S rRNA processing protein RimM [Anaerolineae bacterium]|jgi:16S rRNA processing protein RimM|nr:16S rRNA processing protein RimM [Anaerolineae bacterium]MBT7070666.1 16S rRNA processing protein RimM [Anaerolineae bacterium]MBT7326294.1 16S rRNA processing protein RimM [Anaerolineae bacterium]
MTDSRLSKNANTGSPAEGEPVYLVVGLLRRPHGVRGEIMLEIKTDYPERIEAGEKFYLGDARLPVTIATRRPHNKGLLLSFEGIADRDAIGRHRNHSLYVLLSDWPPLPEGEYYDFELVGLKVVEEATGEVLGNLKEIIKTGANDVYLVKSESGREILLPAIPDVILDVDLAQCQMSVYLLPGLVDEK